MDLEIVNPDPEVVQTDQIQVEENVNTNTEANVEKSDENADNKAQIDSKTKTKGKRDIRFQNVINACDYPLKEEEEEDTFIFSKEEFEIDYTLSWDEPSEKKDITDPEIKSDTWALHNGVIVKIESIEDGIATLAPEDENKEDVKIEAKPIATVQVSAEIKSSPAELTEEEMINQAIALSLQETLIVEEVKPEADKVEEVVSTVTATVADTVVETDTVTEPEAKTEPEKVEDAVEGETKPEESKEGEEKPAENKEGEDKPIEEKKEDEVKPEEEKKDEVKKITVPVKELKNKAHFKFTVNMEDKQLKYPDLELEINQTISSTYGIVSEIICLPKEKFVVYVMEDKQEQDSYECLFSVMNKKDNKNKPYEINVFVKGITYKAATMKRSTSRDYSLSDKKHLSVFKVTHPITLTGVGFNRHYYDANLAKYDMRIYKFDQCTKRKQLLLTMNGIEVKSNEVDSTSFIKMVKIDSLDLDANTYYFIHVDFAIDDMRTYYFYSGSATIEEHGVVFTFYNVSGVKERISYTNGMSGWLDFIPRKLLD